ADPRGVLPGRASAPGRARGAGATRGAPHPLRGLERRQGARARPAPDLAGADGPPVAVDAGGRRSSRRLPALPDHHEDAVSRPRRPLDGRPPGARPTLVRPRDREGARPGLRPGLPPRRRPRDDLYPGRPAPTLPRALPAAPAALVSRRRPGGPHRLQAHAGGARRRPPPVRSPSPLRPARGAGHGAPLPALPSLDRPRVDSGRRLRLGPRRILGGASSACGPRGGRLRMALMPIGSSSSTPTGSSAAGAGDGGPVPSRSLA